MGYVSLSNAFVATVTLETTAMCFVIIPIPISVLGKPAVMMQRVLDKATVREQIHANAMKDGLESSAMFLNA
ncbi:MAG: hypothetical protein ACTSUE_14015 [Promethearchaeota archaeon]